VFVSQAVAQVPTENQPPIEEPKYLEPIRSAFSGWHGQDDYYRNIREKLFPGSFNYLIRVLEIPSFELEWAVSVQERDFYEPGVKVKRFADGSVIATRAGEFVEPKKRYYAVYSSASEPIYNNKKISKVRVLTSERQISSELASKLLELWSSVLSKTSYSEYGGGADGTTYYFFCRSPELGLMEGSTWSPKDGSKLPLQMVRLANQLRELAQSKSTLSEDDLKSQVQSVIDNFGLAR